MTEPVAVDEAVSAAPPEPEAEPVDYGETFEYQDEYDDAPVAVQEMSPELVDQGRQQLEAIVSEFAGLDAGDADEVMQLAGQQFRQAIDEGHFAHMTDQAQLDEAAAAIVRQTAQALATQRDGMNAAGKFLDLEQQFTGPFDPDAAIQLAEEILPTLTPKDASTADKRDAAVQALAVAVRTLAADGDTSPMKPAQLARYYAGRATLLREQATQTPTHVNPVVAKWAPAIRAERGRP